MFKQTSSKFNKSQEKPTSFGEPQPNILVMVNLFVGEDAIEMDAHVNFWRRVKGRMW